jgi:hypothetical protein
MSMVAVFVPPLVILTTSCKRLSLSISEARRVRFMTYFLSFLQKNGLNSRYLLRMAFVVTAQKECKPKAYKEFPLAGLGWQ